LTSDAAVAIYVPSHVPLVALVVVVQPAAPCELLDRTFLEVVATGGGTASNAVPSGAEAALLAEVEGTNAETAGRAAPFAFFSCPTGC
jgi:hypothetical protein